MHHLCSQFEKRYFLLLWLIGLSSFPQHAGADGFNLEELDSGRAVTLPHPATTYISLPNIVTLSATDRGQTLKLMAAPGEQLTGLRPFSVTIEDPVADQTREIRIHPGQPVVYAFKTIGKIVIKASEAEGDKTGKSTRLQVESNRPMEICNGQCKAK